MKDNWKVPFFTLWIGQAFSLFGSQLVQFALVWWLTRTTGSAAVLAGASLFAILPQVFLGPIAGPLIDRWNRRAVMFVADSVVAWATLVLIALFATGVIQPWHIYMIMLIRSAGGAFHFPTMQASTSLMVPESQLGRVQGLNSMLSGGMSIVAPLLGALLIEALPVQGVLSVDIITAALGLGALALVKVPQPQRVAKSETPNVWREMKDGLLYIRTLPGLVILLAMAVLINFLLVPGGSLLPLLVRNHFGGGAPEFAKLESAFGIGIVAGGLLLGIWGGFKRKIVTSQVGLIGVGAAHLVLGLLAGTEYQAALAALFAAGLMFSLNNVAFAALQAVVEPEMQGRVFTLIGSLTTAVAPLSLAVAGPLSDTLGVRFWYVAAGICCMAMGAIALSIPSVVNAEELTRKMRAKNALPVVADTSLVEG